MKFKPLILVTLAMILGGIGLAAFVAPSWHHHRLMRNSEPIQLALEDYRQQHGVYPESLSAAKISEPEKLYYRRQPDGSYILWFGTSLGESMTFHSTDHLWK